MARDSNTTISRGFVNIYHTESGAALASVVFLGRGREIGKGIGKGIEIETEIAETGTGKRKGKETGRENPHLFKLCVLSMTSSFLKTSPLGRSAGRGSPPFFIMAIYIFPSSFHSSSIGRTSTSLMCYTHFTHHVSQLFL